MVVKRHRGVGVWGGNKQSLSGSPTGALGTPRVHKLIPRGLQETLEVLEDTDRE